MTLIRRWAIAVFCLGLFALPNLAAAKYAAIVVDADTGRVLHGANANTRNHPASLTKMMTLYMLFDAVESGRLKLDSPLKVSQRAAGMAPSKLGLRAGATISVEDAIQALITKSANDVAAVVAENLDKSEAQFAKSMTAKAHTLGMSRSTFKNASGLPNKAQFSSARDMALLARALMTDFPQFYHYFSIREFAHGKDVMRSHNNLLFNYEGADGIKTGYTVASGFNLVSSAQRNGKRLIGVVFGGKSARTRDTHMVNLLDAGFAEMAGDTGALTAAPLIDTLESNEGLPKLAAIEGTIGVGDIDTDDAPARQMRVASAPAKTVTDPARQWGIQVGAYGSRTKAAEAAALARSRLAGTFDGVIDRIEPAPWKGNKTLYRAQVIGLKQADTSAACELAGIETKVGCRPVAIAPAKKKNATRTARR